MIWHQKQWLLALLILAYSSNPQIDNVAQAVSPTACTPLGSAHVFTSLPTLPPSDLVPDTRPVRVVNLFGGGNLYDCNPYGAAAWAVDETTWSNSPCSDPANVEDDGCVPMVIDNHCPGGVPAREYHHEWRNKRPDVWDKLESILDDLYDDGWRRILINRPAGMYEGDSVPSAQYWTLSKASNPLLTKDRAMWTILQGGYLRHWLNVHPEVKLGVYMGYKIHDPCMLSGQYPQPPYPPTTSPHTIPDPFDLWSMTVSRQNIYPWAGKTPFPTPVPAPATAVADEVWLDASAKGCPSTWPTCADPSVLWFATNATFTHGSYRGRIRFVGEAIPHDGSPYKPKWNLNAITRMPFVAAQRHLEKLGYDSTSIPDVRNVVPRELYVAFIHGQSLQEDESLQVILNYKNRGYIPISWSNATDTAVIAACGGAAAPCQ